LGLSVVVDDWLLRLGDVTDVTLDPIELEDARVSRAEMEQAARGEHPRYSPKWRNCVFLLENWLDTLD
jgi:hypothetical protein